MEFWKKRIPLAIVFLAGITMILTYYSGRKEATDILTGYSKWYQIIAGFALLLGVVSLGQVHITKIQKLKPGWAYSLIMIIAFLIMTISGFVWGIEKGTPFMWIFENVTTPLASTVFSILAFYIASAAYRAFRAKSFEASLMLIAAVLVMVGRIPFGEMFSRLLPDSLSFLRIDVMTQWLFRVPVAAAKRAILLGIGLSSVTMSLRIILGIERTYMGGD